MSNVYVLTGHYRDLSGFYLIGVYESATEAGDRLRVAQSVDPALVVKLHTMPLNSAKLTDVTGG